MKPADADDLLALLPNERPVILAELPAAQARDRAKCFLFFEGVGWASDDAWSAALSLDPLLIDVIKHIALVVPDEVIIAAALARRAPEPDAALLMFHAAVLNGYWKPPPSEITITVASRR